MCSGEKAAQIFVFVQREKEGIWLEMMTVSIEKPESGLLYLESNALLP